MLFPFARIVGLCFFGGLCCWVGVGCLLRAVGFMLGCFVGFACTWVLLIDWLFVCVVPVCGYFIRFIFVSGCCPFPLI